MKIKFLKDVQSIFGSFVAESVHVLEDLKLEAHVIENWTSQGLIEVVNEVKKRVTKSSTDK